jgi:serine/threonine protein kinase
MPHQIVHNDLAARNILVTDKWEMKICNFSLAKNVSSNSPDHEMPKVSKLKKGFYITPFYVGLFRSKLRIVSLNAMFCI